MTTYKEQKEKKRVFVLSKDNEVLGVFGSFKKLCDYGALHDKSFPSYSTLSKIREDKMTVKQYTIQKVKLH